jgi:hypothetical protein
MIHVCGGGWANHRPGLQLQLGHGRVSPASQGYFFFSLSFFFPWCFLLGVFSALLVLSDAFPSFGLSSRSMLLGFVLRGFIFC